MSRGDRVKYPCEREEKTPQSSRNQHRNNLQFEGICVVCDQLLPCVEDFGLCLQAARLDLCLRQNKTKTHCCRAQKRKLNRFGLQRATAFLQKRCQFRHKTIKKTLLRYTCPLPFCCLAKCKWRLCHSSNMQNPDIVSSLKEFFF